VGVYATNTSEVCKYIAVHSDASVLVLENRTYLAKYEPHYEELKKSIRLIVMWNDTLTERDNASKFNLITF